MTIGISNVAAAGSVQVIRPASGVETKSAIANTKASSQNVTDVIDSGSKQSIRQAQALAGLEGQHRAAEAVKHAESAFGQIGKVLGQIRDSLELTIKLYPPYPTDNRERMEMLNSIAGLRKQIDALTYPPPDREQVSLLGDPSLSPAAGDLNFTLGDQPYTLHAQPAHTGPEGLNVPLLGEQASGAEVELALGSLRQAQERLAAKQAAFTKELDAILLPQANQVDELVQSSRGELASQSGPISQVPAGLSDY